MKMQAVTTMQNWLLDPGSFMKRLKEYGVHDANIRILDEGFRVPLADERKILAILPRAVAWVREVIIESGDTIWMSARTVIPKETLTGKQKKLQYLKNKSLGSVLFKDPKLQRSRLEIKACLPNWRRRSVFCTAGKFILLTEIFSPAVGLLK